LAGALRAAGRTAEAVPLLEQSLADLELALGYDHPDARIVRENLDAARLDCHGPTRSGPTTRLEAQPLSFGANAGRQDPLVALSSQAATTP
jgi:hypothetical protein